MNHIKTLRGMYNLMTPIILKIISSIHHIIRFRWEGHCFSPNSTTKTNIEVNSTPSKTPQKICKFHL